MIGRFCEAIFDMRLLLDENVLQVDNYNGSVVELDAITRPCKNSLPIILVTSAEEVQHATTRGI
jgi:hypothetical protein